jgi:general secretion pathway protein H
MRGATQTRASAAGFTLVEILVVVAILSTLAMMAAPLLRRSPAQAQLRADVARLAAALRLTRAAAMAQNRAIGLSLYTESRTFVSPAVPAFALDPRTEVGMEIGDGGINGGSGGMIRFFPSGRSNGGRIHLRLDQSVARVDVVWATGNVFVNE